MIFLVFALLKKTEECPGQAQDHDEQPKPRKSARRHRVALRICAALVLTYKEVYECIRSWDGVRILDWVRIFHAPTFYYSHIHGHDVRVRLALARLLSFAIERDLQ